MKEIGDTTGDIGKKTQPENREKKTQRR